MLYATAKLFLPSGAVLHQQVLETDGGVVISFSPFTCENHSMIFVHEIHLFNTMPCAAFNSTSVAGGELCACVRDAAGGWRLLE